jgi:hypothetical protein
MALLVAMGDLIPPVASAGVFLAVCVVSLILQCPLRIFKSIFMNTLNIVMEMSLCILAIMTLVLEAGNFSYETNEIIGLVSIILLLIAQLICIVLIILETIYMIYLCIKWCFSKKVQPKSKYEETNMKDQEVGSFDNSMKKIKVDNHFTNITVIPGMTPHDHDAVQVA